MISAKQSFEKCKFNVDQNSGWLNWWKQRSNFCRQYFTKVAPINAFMPHACKLWSYILGDLTRVLKRRPLPDHWPAIGFVATDGNQRATRQNRFHSRNIFHFLIFLAWYSDIHPIETEITSKKLQLYPKTLNSKSSRWWGQKWADKSFC